MYHWHNSRNHYHPKHRQPINIVPMRYLCRRRVLLTVRATTTTRRRKDLHRNMYQSHNSRNHHHPNHRQPRNVVPMRYLCRRRVLSTARATTTRSTAPVVTTHLVFVIMILLLLSRSGITMVATMVDRIPTTRSTAPVITTRNRRHQKITTIIVMGVLHHLQNYAQTKKTKIKNSQMTSALVAPATTLVSYSL